jgi:hypothetical protein
MNQDGTDGMNVAPRGSQGAGNGIVARVADEWKHYQVRRQPIGTPANGQLVWTHVWKVLRPCGHPTMQGDDWERHYSRQFDSHQEAIAWASREAVKDQLRYEAEEWLAQDENIDELATAVLNATTTLQGLFP